MVDMSIYIPFNNAQEFFFLDILNICYSFFYESHSNSVWQYLIMFLVSFPW